MFQFIVLAVVVAAVNCQYLTPTLTSQNQNTYRSYGNLGQVSTFSKTIDTPYSSVSKSDVRVSNPGITVSHGISPISHGLVSPLAYSHAPVAQTYSTVSHAPISHGYAAPISHGYASPISHGYAAPLAHSAYNAPIAHAGLLGVAYSSAPAVAHTTYSNGLGLNYAW